MASRAKNSKTTRSRKTNSKLAGARLLLLNAFNRNLAILFVVTFCVVGGYVFYAASHAATAEVASGIAGYCLDDFGNATTDGSQIDMYKCNGSAAQQWVVSGKTLQLHGKCLDAYQQGTANGTKIELYTCNGGANQQWTFTGTSPNSTLVGAQSGKCLDDTGWGGNGTRLELYTCNGGANQKWYTSFYGQTPAPTPSPNNSTAKLTPVGVQGNWALKLDDEFNGTSLSSSWNAEGPRLPNNATELSCYSPNNVSVSGGYLNMALTNNSCTVSGKTFPYTGAQIDTNGHYNPTFGYFESRVYSPGANGKISNWPAWWMFGPNWPRGGEIDTFEGLNGYAGWHFDHPDANGNSVWQGSNQTGQDFTGWHVYGVNWQPNAITYYYDGVKVGTITSGVTNQPMQLVIDNTTSPVNNSGGPIVVPATMKVDYVRVWQ